MDFLRARFILSTSFRVGLCVCLYVCSSVARAQSSIDPSSALLLNSPARMPRTVEKPSTEARLDSGRYTVRPRPSSEKTPSAKKPVSEPNSPVATVIAPTEQGNVILPEETARAPEPSPAIVESSDSGSVIPSSNHLLEISLATAYLYEGSESEYSYRQWTTSGPAYAAGARVWLSPEFAIGGRYLSSLGGRVSERSSAIDASRTEIAYGLYLKRPFSRSDLTFGVEYVDSQFKISGDAASKLKTKSVGVRLSVEGEFRSEGERSAASSWILGFSATPKVQHEESPSGTDARSGTGVNAYVVGASLERRWRFDPSNSISMKIEHRLERDLFSGSANVVDPVSGVTPNGVGVTVGTTLIQFAYTWGG